MRSRLVVAFLAAALMVPLGVTQAVAAPANAGPTAAPSGQVCRPYPDVGPHNLHCSNIAWLKDSGITKPTDGRYYPNASLKRGEMAAFLFRLANPRKPSPACTSKPFPDVSVSSVFCGYIAWAKRHGLAAGYADGDYHADEPVTRRAMAAYLHRLLVPGKPARACNTSPYPDVSVSNEFCAVITWMKDTGMTYGVAGGTYGALQPVTRQAMASFLRRSQSEQAPDTVLRSFLDYNTSGTLDADIDRNTPFDLGSYGTVTYLSDRCMVTADGSVWQWDMYTGREPAMRWRQWVINDQVQDPIAVAEVGMVPQRVPGVRDAVSCHEGYIVRADGSLWHAQWAVENYRDPAKARLVAPKPERVPKLRDIALVKDDLALTRGGEVWELNGSAVDGWKPRKVAGLRNVVDVMEGAALLRDGTVWQWISVEYPAGDKTGDLSQANWQRHAPRRVKGVSNVTAIEGMPSRYFMLKSDGTVWAWGWNHEGNLGDGTSKVLHTPTRLPGLNNITAIHDAIGAAFALRTDGTVYKWGRFAAVKTPHRIPGLTNIAWISDDYFVRRTR